MNVQPQLAPVQPRAISPDSGEILPLVDIVCTQLETGASTIRLTGNGKSTALAHLAACFQEDNADGVEFPCVGNVRFIDGGSVIDNYAWDLTVFVSSNKYKADVDLHITGWSADDCIEYLIQRAPDRCASVMNRLTDRQDPLHGLDSPIVLRPVMDRMIDSDEVSSIADAIVAEYDSLDLNEQDREQIVIEIARLFLSPERALAAMVPEIIAERTFRFLTTRPVNYVIAAGKIASDLDNATVPEVIGAIFPYPLLKLVAERIRNSELAIETLKGLTGKPDDLCTSTVASLLLMIDENWKPSPKSRMDLRRAILHSANWDDITLESCCLEKADFSGASLCNTHFHRSVLTEALFHRAYLVRAQMSGVQARLANFNDAILRHVVARETVFDNASFVDASLEGGDFTNSDFRNAEMLRTNLDKTNLTGVDFTGALLDGATFVEANLAKAMLQRQDLTKVDLTSASCTKTRFYRSIMENLKLEASVFDLAYFSGTILTGSQFRKCLMRACDFSHAKLADIVWDECDLRNSNFDHCHFMMGSTRCGTVDSPYPSHGTRTNFYTDDYDDQNFKRPEDIRKAAMVDCDLRGAKVDQADFYLVDLRGAKYDADQRRHFMQCGAILDE